MENLLDVMSEENQKLIRLMAKSLYRKFLPYGRKSYSHIDYSDLIQIGNIEVIKASKLFDPLNGASFRTFTFRKRVKFAMINSIIRNINMDQIDENFTENEDEFEEYRQSENIIQKIESYLNEKEIQVLYSRFGIQGYEIDTFKNIGIKLGISKTRACSIEKEIIKKLRDKFEVNNKKDILDITKKGSKETRRFVGVYFSENQTNKYRACIYIEGKLKHIGSFFTETEAAKEYDKYARTLGRPVNFPKDGEKKAIPDNKGKRKP